MEAESTINLWPGNHSWTEVGQEVIRMKTKHILPCLYLDQSSTKATFLTHFQRMLVHSKPKLCQNSNHLPINHDSDLWIPISWVSARKNTLFWCLPVETNGLSLTFSLFGIPGEEEMTGFKLNASWSVEKCDQWEECSEEMHHKRPLRVHVLWETVHVVKSGHLLPLVQLFCSYPSGIINDFCCAGTVAEGF